MHEAICPFGRGKRYQNGIKKERRYYARARERERTVRPAEAVDGSDEAPVELARPPQPRHRGPVVPPRRHPVAPAAGATHLALSAPRRQPPVTFFHLLFSRGAAVCSRARWPPSLRVASYSSLARRPSLSVSWLHFTGRPGCLYIVGRQLGAVFTL